MAITNGSTGDATDFIDEAERDATPANDEGRVAKLESDGRIHENFLDYKSLDVQEFSADGTWTKPSEGTRAIIELWGGGGSGASYLYTGDTDTGGGGGGGYLQVIIELSKLASTVSVTIGSGGIAPTLSSIAGANGTQGGVTSFGSLLKAYGGGGGGRYNAIAGGGAGANLFSNGQTAVTGNKGTAEHPPFNGDGGDDSTAPEAGLYSGGGGAGIGVGAGYENGGDAYYGGAGGGGSSETNAGTGGSSLIGGDGGAGGTGANGTDGSIKGGGGGGGNKTSGTVKGGDGGDGFARITVF